MPVSISASVPTRFKRLNPLVTEDISERTAACRGPSAHETGGTGDIPRAACACSTRAQRAGVIPVDGLRERLHIVDDVAFFDEPSPRCGKRP